MKLKERLLAPTPKFWKKMQKIGGALVAVSVLIASAGTALPVVLGSASVYLGVVGGTITTVAQFAVEGPTNPEENAQ